MKVRDMNDIQLKKYIEDNYSFGDFLELLTSGEMKNIISKNEYIDEDYDNE